MENDIHLLDCPFCGCDTAHLISELKTFYSVECLNCGAVTALTNKRKAIELWNRRAESKICIPTDTGSELHGTDCPAWKCSVCGDLFEADTNYCSQCGAKVVLNELV